MLGEVSGFTEVNNVAAFVRPAVMLVQARQASAISLEPTYSPHLHCRNGATVDDILRSGD
jgi:hypothetical protein